MKNLKNPILATLITIIFIFQNVSMGQDDMRIAILDFKNLTPREDLDFLERAIPEIMITDLAQSNKLTIIERSNLDKILDEMQLSLSGLIDDKQVVKIGEMAGANSILVGSIIKGGDVFRIDSRLIDVESGKIIIAEKRDWLSEDEIIFAVDNLAEQIIFKLTGEDMNIGEEPPDKIDFPSGNSLAMETALDNTHWLVGSDNPVYLQIDLFSRQIENNDRLPLNVSVVLDRSGSMAVQKKLDYAKRAVLFIAQNLTEQDNFSLVTYEENVDVPISAQKVDNLDYINWQINKINPVGSTNLSAGMIEGYSQAAKYFQPSHQVNRVLLLSDGLANRGITEQGKLEQICREQSANSVSISCFGIGLDFNEDLLLGLAENGSGNYYFINKPEKIPEIFTRELNGLLAVSAQNVKVIVKLDKKIKLEEICGYLYDQQENEVTINIGNIFSNEHKTILVKLIPDGKFSGLHDLAEVILEYEDATVTGDRISEISSLEINYTKKEKKIRDNRNRKVNETALLFQSSHNMQKAIKLADEGDIGAAQLAMNTQLAAIENPDIQPPQSKVFKKQILSIYKYSQSLKSFDNVSEKKRKEIQKANKFQQYNVQKQKNSDNSSIIDIPESQKIREGEEKEVQEERAGREQNKNFNNNTGSDDEIPVLSPIIEHGNYEAEYIPAKKVDRPDEPNQYKGGKSEIKTTDKPTLPNREKTSESKKAPPKKVDTGRSSTYNRKSGTSSSSSSKSKSTTIKSQPRRQSSTTTKSTPQKKNSTQQSKPVKVQATSTKSSNTKDVKKDLNK